MSLSFHDLAKTYPDGTAAVKGITQQIAAGEFTVLLGPSGCGKTTTLRMIAGLELPTAGRIELAGREVTRLRPAERDVGFVFQFYALYPHLRVRDNILFPLAAMGMPRPARLAALARVAERLQLQPLLQRFPGQLSGGDQQRVSLARAMVRKPAAYLMDEPLGTLDAELRPALREFIREQQLALAVTTVYVTHDQEEAMSLGDRIIVMADGRIAQDGPPLAVYDDPACRFVAEFVGCPGMNFIDGTFTADGSRLVFTAAGNTLMTVAAAPALAGRQVTMGIRGEYLRPDDSGPLPAKVLLDEYGGAHRSVHLQTPAGTVIMRAPAGPRFGADEAITLAWEPQHVCWFDQSTGERLRGHD